MERMLFLFATYFLGLATNNAQQLTGRIVDAATQKSIPFATVRVAEVDLISNKDGYFTFSPKNDADIIAISFIGYDSKQLSISQLKQNNNIVYLTQGSYDIGEVYVTNQKPHVDTLIHRAQKALRTLYSNTDIKQTIFTRNSTEYTPKIAEVKIKKSTEFSKNELKKLNDELAKFTSSLIHYPPKEFTDRLVNYYTSAKKINDKPTSITKVEVIKAVKLHDQNRSTDLNDLSKTATHLILKYVDTTKFYRIKSGLFGSRDTISFSKEYNKQSRHKTGQQPLSENQKIRETKSNINTLRATLWHPEINFMHKTELYKYTLLHTTFLDDRLVYIIEFVPKKRKAKYSGKLYINAEDYAILRVDYELADGKNLHNLNLKLILGIKNAQNISKGTMIYKQVPDRDTYYLYYASTEWGQYFYINRPLKLIEITKNKKERNVISFNIKVEGNHFSKNEYLCTSISSVTAQEVDNITETEFNYEIQTKYNPNIWIDYDVIEPLEEMKKFEIIE